MTAQHIWIDVLVLFEIISLAVGNNYSLSVSSSNKTWFNTFKTGENCMLAEYADVETLRIPTGYEEFGPVWLSSKTVFSEWIHLNGCFTSNIIDQTNLTFTTSENCLKFCGGNFGITGDKCICPKSYTPYVQGCLAWTCSTEDEVFCGNTKDNLGKDCVCEYMLENRSVIQADAIGYNCVAHHSDKLSVYAHRCSDNFPPLCVDLSIGDPEPYDEKLKWTGAGHFCYSENKQFCSSIRFRNSNYTSRQSNSTYWVATYRINMTKTNVSLELWRSLYCPAVINHNISEKRVLRPCTEHLPALCLTQQTSHKQRTTLTQQTSPKEQTTLKQQTSPKEHTSLKQQTSPKEQTTLKQQTSPEEQTWFTPVLIASIITCVMFIGLIVICVLRRRRRRQQTKRKAEVSLSEVGNLSLPTQSQGNNGHNGELNRGNSDNDIYNELHENNRRRPNNQDELYDHVPTDNSIYGQLHQSHVTCGESAYDSMAAIRCAEGTYGTTAYQSSVTDGDYGHLTACGPK